MLEIVLTVVLIVTFVATIFGYIEFDEELQRGNYTDNEMLKWLISFGVTASIVLIVVIVILLHERFGVN